MFNVLSSESSQFHRNLTVITSILSPRKTFMVQVIHHLKLHNKTNKVSGKKILLSLFVYFMLSFSGGILAFMFYKIGPILGMLLPSVLIFTV